MSEPEPSTGVATPTENASAEKTAAAAHVRAASSFAPQTGTKAFAAWPVVADGCHETIKVTGSHSKLPMFMRLHGSILPRMLVPMIVLTLWSTLITCLCQFVYPLVVNTVLLTVLGLIVGLAISFRTSGGYERFVDGRKYWAQLMQASRDLGRHLWIHVRERTDEGDEVAKRDLLGKLTALNLIVAFAVALKHKLRFEPYTHHEDLRHRVQSLETFAGAASDLEHGGPRESRKAPWKKLASTYFDISFASSDPRKAVRRAKHNLGNLPLEILLHLSTYIEALMADGMLPADARQAQVRFVLRFFQHFPATNLAFLPRCTPVWPRSTRSWRARSAS